MGSFNATCAVTNRTVTEGDRIVCFLVIANTTPDGRARSSCDAIASPYVVASWPMRGIYNDYGRFLADDGKEYPNEEMDTEVMLILEYAYDLIKYESDWADAEDENFKYDHYKLAEGGELPEYITSRAEKVESALQYLESTDPDAYSPMMWARELFHAPEGEYLHTQYWSAAIEQYAGDKRAFYQSYKNDVRWLFGATFMFNFRIRPTLYGSQEPHSEAQMALALATVKNMEEEHAARVKANAEWDAKYAQILADKAAEKTDADD